MGTMINNIELKTVSDLVFGVGSIHRLPFRRQRIQLLQQALDMGFRNFDVAPAYGNGLNELELGIALTGFLATCKITTKFGIPSDMYGAQYPGIFFLLRGFHRIYDRKYGDEYKRRIFNVNEMVLSLEGSLRRLKRDYIDNFLIHEPLGLIENVDLMDMGETAQRMKEQGKILRWGVAGPATSIVQFENNPLIDIFQFPLEDMAKVCVPPLSRKVVYGVYHAYKGSLGDQDLTFAEFVKKQRIKTGADIVIASTSSRTLASFQDCF